MHIKAVTFVVLSILFLAALNIVMLGASTGSYIAFSTSLMLMAENTVILLYAYDKLIEDHKKHSLAEMENFQLRARNTEANRRGRILLRQILRRNAEEDKAFFQTHAAYFGLSDLPEEVEKEHAGHT